MINRLSTATRKHLPWAYPFLRSLAIGAIHEVRMVRGMGMKGILTSVFRVSDPWYQELPVQQIRRATVPFELAPSSSSETSDILSEAGIAHSSGRHAVYLSPEQWRSTVFQDLMSLYPEGTGLKIMGHPGGIETYYVAVPSPALYRVASYGHRHLMIVAHYLFAKGVGPEPRDLLEIQLGPRKLVGYAIEHVPERPTLSDAQALIRRLRALTQDEALLCVAPKGMDHDDFLPPDFGDNIRIRPGNGGAVYVDFQNFALRAYDKYLEQVAREAVTATHFGDKCLLRGGRHLYQSIPGVALPSNRDLRKRMLAIDGLLLQAGETISDRIVLDVGCNLGMAIAEYLRRGARWCFGWDLPATIPHSNRILRAIGCTRFELYARDLNRPGELEADLPRKIPNGCLLSYLAMRKHIGWHTSVVTLPWTTMIYEGHEGEDEERSLEYLNELRQLVEIEAVHYGMHEDGGRTERFVAVIKRKL